MSADNWVYITGGVAAIAGALGAIKTYYDIKRQRQEIDEKQRLKEEGAARRGITPLPQIESLHTLPIPAGGSRLGKWSKAALIAISVVVGGSFALYWLSRPAEEPPGTVTAEVSKVSKWFSYRVIERLNAGEFNGVCRYDFVRPQSSDDGDTWLKNCAKRLGDFWVYVSPEGTDDADARQGNLQSVTVTPIDSETAPGGHSVNLTYLFAEKVFRIQVQIIIQENLAPWGTMKVEAIRVCSKPEYDQRLEDVERDPPPPPSCNGEQLIKGKIPAGSEIIRPPAQIPPEPYLDDTWSEA